MCAGFAEDADKFFKDDDKKAGKGTVDPAFLTFKLRTERERKIPYLSVRPMQMHSTALMILWLQRRHQANTTDFRTRILRCLIGCNHILVR